MSELSIEEEFIIKKLEENGGKLNYKEFILFFWQLFKYSIYKIRN